MKKIISVLNFNVNPAYSHNQPLILESWKVEINGH